MKMKLGPDVRALSDAEIVALLRVKSPINAARAAFSNGHASLEQEGLQRRTPSPIEYRRMEFEFAEQTVQAYLSAVKEEKRDESLPFRLLLDDVRDNLLNGRGALVGVLDNDQTNAVLGELDRLYSALKTSA